MFSTSSFGDITHAIQLAVAPVFLLAGVNTLLAVLTNRLSRSVDRRRVLANILSQADHGLERALADLAGAAGARLQEHFLEEARERLWFVVVHREAIGLTRHEVLYEVLRVPAEVRRAMGPRRRR